MFVGKFRAFPDGQFICQGRTIRDASLLRSKAFLFTTFSFVSYLSSYFMEFIFYKGLSLSYLFLSLMYNPEITTRGDMNGLERRAISLPLSLSKTREQERNGKEKERRNGEERSHSSLLPSPFLSSFGRRVASNSLLCELLHSARCHFPFPAGFTGDREEMGLEAFPSLRSLFPSLSFISFTLP